MRSNETVAGLTKLVEATPTIDTVKAIAGEDAIKHSPDGKWVADLTPQQTKQFVEATRPRRRLDIDRGAEESAATHDTKVRGRNGLPIKVPEMVAEQIERKHFQPRCTVSGNPTDRGRVPWPWEPEG